MKDRQSLLLIYSSTKEERWSADALQYSVLLDTTLFLQEFPVVIDHLLYTPSEVLPLWLEEVLELTHSLEVLINRLQLLEILACARHDPLFAIDDFIEWVQTGFNSKLGK
jgi:hypothetical protein